MNVLKKILLFLLIFVLAHPCLYAQKPRVAQVRNLVNTDSEAACDSLVRKYFAYAGFSTTTQNQVKLLINGTEKFNDLFAAIRRARHHIHLEYFNFRNDSIASELFTLLAQKAREGVEVRAMFDAFGNMSNNRPLKKEHLARIREQGIEIVEFDPFRFPWINHAIHRDHRKIVVIDGIVGYTGGMNIADYYIKGLPELGAWHDMHLCIEGEAVRSLQGIFLTMWNQETGQYVGGPEYFPPLPYIDPAKRVEMAIVDRWPKESPRSISHAYTAAIYSARDRIRIINPYFLPTGSIRRALKRALKRGTEVEIMIPSVSDIPFTPEASLYYTHKLMKHGAKIYLFDNGFHHSKVMMIDSTFCTVGTANLNSRSLRWDYETNAFMFSPAVSDSLHRKFLHDAAHSRLMTPELWRERSAWKKFVGWVGNLLTPFL